MSDIQEEMKRQYKRAEENDIKLLQEEKELSDSLLLDADEHIKELQDRINKATRHIEILLEIALEQDSENVNLIDRLKGILNILKGDNK